MGAVAGEPHSPVERGKAKAENRKKDGCLVLCDPASLGYNAGPPSPRGQWKDAGSCLKLLQSGRFSMMYLIWKSEK